MINSIRTKEMVMATSISTRVNELGGDAARRVKACDIMGEKMK